VLKQKEASFGIVFRAWMRAHPLMTGAYELKQHPAYAIPFHVLADEQIAYLLMCKSDKGAFIRVQGLKGEPDYVYLRNSSAWVVVKFKDSFHVIDIDAFLLEKATSTRKSLTAGRAKQISTWDQNI